MSKRGLLVAPGSIGCVFSVLQSQMTLLMTGMSTAMMSWTLIEECVSMPDLVSSSESECEDEPVPHAEPYQPDDEESPEKGTKVLRS